MADILHSIHISARADTIYPLISTAQGLTQWWAADVSESGGAVELAFFNRQTVYRLRAQINQRPSHVEWACETGKEWAGTRLDLQAGTSRHRNAGPFHSRGLAIRNGLFRFLHHDLG